MSDLKLTFRLLFVFTFLLFLSSCKTKNREIETKKVVEQDSISVFVLKNYQNISLWENLSRIYENDYNIRIKYNFFSDLKTLLDSIKFADVVLGIDKTNYSFLQKDTIFINYRPINYQNIKRVFRPIENNTLIPYAYNYNVLYYKEYLKNYPKTLAVMQDHDLYNRVVLFNPSTTFIGRDFILQSLATYTNLGCRRFWRGIRKSVKQIENTPEAGVKDFKSKDVYLLYFPLVNPYIKDENYFLPSEGYFCSVFYMGIPKTAPILEKSKRFIDFMLFDKAQNEIYASNYAIPVSTEVLNFVADKINLKKRGRNLCNKPKPKTVRINFKYLGKIWRKTFRRK